MSLLDPPRTGDGAIYPSDAVLVGSFKLDGDPPTLTVEAACSKHRKKDTLPIHPELVGLLREWLPTLDDGAFLFPKLERKKTWRMVKVDLEAVGIAYETAEGIADFHAAGRHSHVSGLVNSGVSLAHARQLARHGDVRMTMRYTHVGLEDQAEALRSLPTIEKSAEGGLEPAARAASGAEQVQRYSTAPKRPEGHSVAFAGTESELEVEVGPIKNPCGNRGYDTEGHSESSGGKTAKKWRRRESKDRTGFRKWLSDQSLGLFRCGGICSRVAYLRHFGSRTVTGRHCALSRGRNLAVVARTYQARDASACRHSLQSVRSRARLSVHFAPVRLEMIF